MRWSTRGRCGGSASRLGWRRCCLSGALRLAVAVRLQGRELGLQVGLVSGQRLFEDLALLGVHALALGAELPGLQPRQLERDALDLRVAPLDRLRLRVDALALRIDVFALLGDVGQHLRRQLGQFGGAQSLEVLGSDRMHIEHGVAVCMSVHAQVIGACSNCTRVAMPRSLTCA